jgi:hypothetical protein
MRFLVTRSSTWGEGQPCDEAVEVEPNDIGWKFKINWQVDFDTLEALMEFCKREGRVVIMPPKETPFDKDREAWVIEIYDDYRE